MLLRTIQDFFKLGMDREIPSLAIPPSEGRRINLGAGNKLIPGTEPLDWPGWKAGKPMPYPDETVSEIHAYHFFEHLTKEELIAVLQEVERVLKPGGVIHIVVPHAMSEMAYNDVDHRSYFNEEAFPKLFNNPYYSKYCGEWKLKVHAIFIMGIVYRNLAIFIQLVKEG